MAINYNSLAFPKPGDMAREPVHIYPNGREVCDINTRAGYAEYRSRVLTMLERQSGHCCLEGYAPGCPGHCEASDATFEHEWGRGFGGGKRDDRIILPSGIWINGAAHQICNAWKGSRYIDFNRGFQRPKPVPGPQPCANCNNEPCRCRCWRTAHDVGEE